MACSYTSSFAGNWCIDENLDANFVKILMGMYTKQEETITTEK